MNLVTGGGGFIGSHLVGRLLREGQKVRVVDNFITGKKENLKEYIGKIELVEGNILDLEFVNDVMNGIEVVFHQAALRSVPLSVDNPLATNEVNVQGTLNVLICARDAGVKKVVYASSSSVYGDSPQFPKTEDLAPAPISPYAVSKLAGENYCSVFKRIYGLDTISLRYFNVFGPRQDPGSPYAAVIPRFIRAALMDEELEVHGDGLQSRDFTYVDDVVEANFLAARSQDARGEAFNVAQGESHSLLDLVALLEKVLRKKLRLNHTPPRSGDVHRTLADISRSERGLGYRPSTSFETGILATIESLAETSS